MRVISTVKEMQSVANEIRGEGKTISFVPTMGALHEGHLSLISEGRKKGDVLVVSIFVNPTQFAPSEDLSEYPRNLEGDLEKINGLGVDIVFTPTVGEMYPDGFQTYVEVKELERHLCGRFRPGHFRGVATVVLKLFNIVKPHFALFGEKDYQQLKIVQRMVKDLNLEVTITGYPTVRDKNGLAMSSRNSYLSEDEKERAVSISRALSQIKMEFDRGLRDSKVIKRIGKDILKENGIDTIDYLEICDPDTLEPKESAEGGDLVAVAVRLGRARLIDNTRL
ncbi:MAG TPA: pantoate--beta-alanine ligase [Thermodesulfobacteriota bacterium]|nr:pantoate--beta-alanine ligase [Thermodesulfobacteriota bacterium]